MEVLLAPVVGLLFACAVYLLLQRSLGHVIIGLALLSNAANLFIFVASGLGDGAAPIVDPLTKMTPEGSADPVPQALILTAIVIGFGVLAFFITLAYRVYRITGTDDLEALPAADRPSAEEDGQLA
ncbi:MAG: Na+/H+ antiporter subunit C [Dehalococcoidia bacterium]|nr:Na+/H+ antiporter subunit C [Dehalococcoidia bacterium]MCA9850275.1 Na+/H+ antiporter subunit C [Dehalococcoidia bacterium]MCA9856546.1 Na+/H+ antiporter subunit C [Dehalococcoidia bacterium]MCB9491052.1 Na+/H+ antiporter subunit C [Dehalococcoidia bacterium]